MNAKETHIERDRSLCEGLRASDKEALAEVFRIYRDRLVYFARNMVKDDMTAHDLVQDVFVYLWKLRDKLDPSRPLKPYLYSMTRNRALRHIRDTKNHDAKHDQIKAGWLGLASSPERPDEAFENAQVISQVRKWVTELPPRQHEALQLSRFHGLSHEEIAGVMDISPRTVNNHIVRALDYLQGRIRAYNLEQSAL